MTKHIILWKLDEALNEEEKQTVKENAKAALEDLKGKIDGLTDIKVNIAPLPSSNCDMMLETEFVSPEALKAYQNHPAHVAAAGTFVRPFISVRLCFDFMV